MEDIIAVAVEPAGSASTVVVVLAAAAVLGAVVEKVVFRLYNF